MNLVSLRLLFPLQVVYDFIARRFVFFIYFFLFVPFCLNWCKQWKGMCPRSLAFNEENVIPCEPSGKVVRMIQNYYSGHKNCVLAM